jgi:CDGSH-type Zn-finger protein
LGITCLANGPYLVAGAQLRREDGSLLPVADRTALCRCGGSSTKPVCDGTHRRNGFTDENRARPALDRRAAYAGKSITIFDNRGICSHAGFCTDSLKPVFRMGQEPWIDPDGAAAEAIVEAVRKCPSGALSYSIDGVEHRDQEREAAVTVTDHGPYAVTGGIELVGIAFGEGASREHYTLCRCGASKNKPFCDGSHWTVEFRDRA